MTATPRKLLTILVSLGVTFQVGHFAEHAVQFMMWVFNDRNTPWMSPWAMWLSHQLGCITVRMSEQLCGGMNVAKYQMMVGMEVLHIIGNSIFLGTLFGIYRLMPGKWMRRALYVEGFHLVEHLMLTTSVLYFQRPLGLSTLFGHSLALFGQQGAVGYRVFWHFGMNLIPSAFMMMAMMRKIKWSSPAVPVLS